MEDKSKACWWCNNKADSREHIFKKSDLKRIYGNSSFSHQSAPIIDDGTMQRKIQSINSKFVKWGTNLCSICNNSRSSRFDRTYDEFVTKIQSFFIQIMRDEYIDLRLIFGDEWKRKFKDLIKYYTKHIGCRLSNHELGVTKNIIDFLNDIDDLNDIAFTFEIRPMNKIVADASNDLLNGNYEVLNVGLFHAIKENEFEEKSVIAFFSWLTTGWISFNYLVQPGVSQNEISNLRNSKLFFDIGPIVNLEQLNHLPNIAEKIAYVEDYGRTENSQELQTYYSKIK